MYAPCCHLKIKFRPYLILFLALVFSAFPTTANINQTAEEEKFRQLGNLLKAVVYQWNSPAGLNNIEIARLIEESGIKRDNSTIASVIRAVMYEMTAGNIKEDKLPLDTPNAITEKQWQYLKNLNIDRYAALKSYYVIASAASRRYKQSERLKRSIPSLHALKEELIQSGSTTAVAISSIWLAMEYSELHPLKTVVELEYALPHLPDYDEKYSLETALDKTLAHSWLAEAYMNLNVISRSLEHNLQLIEQAKKNSRLSAFTFSGAIEALCRLTNFSEALKLIKEANFVARQSGDLSQELFVLMLEAGVYANRLQPGDKQRIQRITTDLSRFKDLKLPVNIITSPLILNLYNLAVIGSDTDFKQAIISYSLKINNEAEVAYYSRPLLLKKHQQLRNIYKLRGDFEKALFHQQEYENLLVQSRNLPEQLDNLVNDSPLERDITISKLQRLALSKDKQNLALKAERLQAILFGVVAALTTLLLFWFWRGQRSKAKLGDIDDLTGAFTRRAMFRAASKPMSSKVASCLVLIDLDHFKRINDRFGHVVGDEVLSTFGRVTRERIRKTDTFCRYGGEEFLLYLHDTNEDNAATLLKDIKRSMELHTHWQATDEVFSVSFSAGVVEIKGEKNIEKIIKACDHLLYKAKNAGRGKIETVSIQRYFTEQV